MTGYNNISQVDFSKKDMTRDKEGGVIMIKRSIHQKDTIILNPYPRSSKCMKQEELTEQKGEIDKSTIFEDANAFSLSS